MAGKAVNTGIRLLGGGLLLVVASAAFGQVYKWVDDKGRVHYGERPPPTVKATTVKQQQPSRGVAPDANVVIEKSAVKYYDVRGRTAHELHTSMVENGPFNEIVKQRVYAEIAWDYKWKFDHDERDDGKCRITKFSVTLVTTITMPQWVDSDSAPPEMQALWPSVVAKIRKHEDGHKAIGVEAANVMARRFGALPVYESCDALAAAIRSEGERVVAEYRIAQSAFDRTEALQDSPFKAD